MQKQITIIIGAIIWLLVLMLSVYVARLSNQTKTLEEENQKIKEDVCYDLHIQKNRTKLAHENLVNDIISQYWQAGIREGMKKRKNNISEEEMTIIYNSIDATETKIKELEQKSHEIRQQIASCE